MKLENRARCELEIERAVKSLLEMASNTIDDD